MVRVQKPCATCGETCWGRRCRRCGWAKPKPKLQCATCGVAFTPKQRSETAKYCSLQCHAEALRTTPVRSCEMCGSPFQRRPSGTGKPPRFCSRACADEGRRKGTVKTGLSPTLRPPKSPKPPKPPRSRVYFPTCEMCGRLFCARGSSAKYCSAQCKIDDAGMRVKGLYAAATEFVDGQYSGAEWRQTLLRYLVERDGDRCGICRRKVNITLKSGTRGSPRGPSVDHIVPRSLGGSDDLANLRLTHWGCNQKRGNRGGNEQLALVG